MVSMVVAGLARVILQRPRSAAATLLPLASSLQATDRNASVRQHGTPVALLGSAVKYSLGSATDRDVFWTQCDIE